MESSGGSIDISMYLEQIALHDQEFPPMKSAMPYGTAGFRTDASLLHKVCFRVGVVTTLRARQKGRTGVMITASHNKGSDNGVKIVDFTGEIQSTLWEQKVTKFVNSEDPAAAFQELLEAQDEGEAPISLASKAIVYVGYDTRASSVELTEALVKGVRCAGGDEKNFGLVTTPQLHFLVQLSYKRGSHEVALEDYYAYMREKVERFKANARKDNSKYETKLYIDCADGIGGPSVKKLDAVNQLCEFETLNEGTGAEVFLNEGCGAEYVQKERKLPRNFDPAKHHGAKFASFDGDADRLVYFFTEDKHFGLIDGDRLATLLTVYTWKLLKEIKCKDGEELVSKVSLAVV